MEIIRFKDAGGGPATMVRMSTSEAIATAISLLRQIHDHSGNTNRLESYAKGGYFSISVQPDPTPANEDPPMPSWDEMLVGLAPKTSRRETRSKARRNNEASSPPTCACGCGATVGCRKDETT